jgi:uncharacterized membrane protein YjjP (DUF1212 family)
MTDIKAILTQIEQHKIYVEKAQQDLRKLVHDLNNYIGYYDDTIASLENAAYKLTKEVT